MISYEEAKTLVLKTAQRRDCKTETVFTKNAIGRICAVALKAPLDIQPFDNAAMDGFAVRCSDFDDTDGVLQKMGMIAAGDAVPKSRIQAGQCLEIMTGAPVPPGADAIVPVELVEVNGNQVSFKSQPETGAHIRTAGEDFRKNMNVLKAGQIIHPQHIMPLATLGIDKINVYKKPRAAFLATGNELVEDLSQDLKPGQIYNSNHPYGLSALEAMGVECVSAPTVPDDLDKFQLILNNLIKQEIDLIISSGAVSAGKFDFVRKGLEHVGAEILFHKVKIKPGKPNLFARLPNGALYFGLPGNPVATAAGLRFFCTALYMGNDGHGRRKANICKICKCL